MNEESEEGKRKEAEGEGKEGGRKQKRKKEVHSRADIHTCIYMQMQANRASESAQLKSQGPVQAARRGK